MEHTRAWQKMGQYTEMVTTYFQELENQIRLSFGEWDSDVTYVTTYLRRKFSEFWGWIRASECKMHAFQHGPFRPGLHNSFKMAADANNTRKHSSRMHTTRLETVHASVSIATTRSSRCHSEGGGLSKWTSLNMSKESDHHQMSLAGVGWGSPICLGGYPTKLSRGYPTMWPIPWCIWWYLLHLWTGRCLWNHYLPATTFVGGSNQLMF